MKYQSRPRFQLRKSKHLYAATLILAVTACGQNFNSNSGDKPVGSSNTQSCDASSPQTGFCGAQLIYQSNSFSCHPTWSTLASESAWIDAGLVVPGDIDASPAINRLINYGSNMPLNGSALSEDDYKLLKDWVNSLKN